MTPLSIIFLQKVQMLFYIIVVFGKGVSHTHKHKSLYIFLHFYFFLITRKNW